MRLSGLASGMDTDTMVKQMMQIERMKVDRVEQNKQTILWRQEQYNSVNKTFANFILNTQKDIGLKKTTSTGTMFGSSYKSLDYVKKAESSDETVATVTSTGKTTNGSFEIKVGEPPRNANLTSAVIRDDFFAAKPAEGEQAEKEAIKEMTFQINTRDVNVGDGSKQLTMDDVVKAINNATKNEDGKVVSLGVSAFYDEGTGRMFLESSVDDEKIEITTSKADESEESKKLALAGKEFVEKFNGTTTAIIPLPEGEIPLTPIEKDKQSISMLGVKGKVTVNGVNVDVKNGKVEFNGLIIDIKAAGTTRINVTTNTEGIMEKVEKLVADYNELVDTVSGLTAEKRYSSYKPLSSEERKAMNEDDLKLWDEKAKSGLLNRDSTLERTLQNMRTDIYKTLEGATGSYDHITQIGISTEKYSQGSAGGKLTIDTDKLRKAIEQDADSVMELLFKEPTAMEGRPVEPPKGTDDTEYKRKLAEYQIKNKVHMNEHSGIFTRVYEGLTDSMKDIIDKSGPGKDQALYRGIKSNMLIDFVTKKGSISDLDKSVADMNKQIDSLNILLARKEDAHYAKFAAMEKQMYQMQNQSGWLSQQFQY